MCLGYKYGKFILNPLYCSKFLYNKYQVKMNQLSIFIYIIYKSVHVLAVFGCYIVIIPSKGLGLYKIYCGRVGYECLQTKIKFCVKDIQIKFCFPFKMCSIGIEIVARSTSDITVIEICSRKWPKENVFSKILYFT